MVLTGICAGAGVGRVLGMGQPVKDTIWPVKGTVWPLRRCGGSVQALGVPIPARTQPLIGIQGGCTQGTGTRLCHHPWECWGLWEDGSASSGHTRHFCLPVASPLWEARRAKR